METLDLAASPPAIAFGGNRYRAILRLALPTVFAMLAQSVVNGIDVIFFKHLAAPFSSYAQAALLPSLILTWTFGGSLERHQRRYAGARRRGATPRATGRPRVRCSATPSSSASPQVRSSRSWGSRSCRGWCGR